MQNVISLVVLALVFVAAAVGGWAYQHGEIDLAGLVSAPAHSIDVPWPPQQGQRYPDIELTDLSGRTVRLSEFAGQILIIEPVGISCPACQAFSGGNQLGGFQGVIPQPGLQSFGEYLERFAPGVSLSDPRVRFVQILFYGSDGTGPTTLAEAREWARHFGQHSAHDDSAHHATVLFGDKRYINSATYELIPSFQLVDQNFVLRCDAGKPPRQNPYTELMPMVAKLFQEIQ